MNFNKFWIYGDAEMFYGRIQGAHQDIKVGNNNESFNISADEGN